MSSASGNLGRLPIITIDGPAGAGKTTTAREVARRLNFLHLDTGAMYRALALCALRAGCSLDDPKRIARLTQKANVALQFRGLEQRVLLEGEDVTDLLRSPAVTAAVTPVSQVAQVRRRMVQLQRHIGKRGGLVAEGRDIGTVVFPNAELKIFLVADLTERAQRRLKEMLAAGMTAELTDLEGQISKRDVQDQQRAHSPLKPAPDAIQIDTTHLTFNEQVELILQHLYQLNLISINAS